MLDVAVFAVVSFAEHKQLSAYYLLMAAAFFPGILAVIGLRSLALSVRIEQRPVALIAEAKNQDRELDARILRVGTFGVGIHI